MIASAFVTGISISSRRGGFLVRSDSAPAPIAHAAE